MRTRTHKITIDYHSGAGEMYDLVADPHELRNLFDDPDAGEVRADMEAMLALRPGDIGPNRVPVGMA